LDCTIRKINSITYILTDSTIYKAKTKTYLDDDVVPPMTFDRLQLPPQMLHHVHGCWTLDGPKSL